MGMPVIEPGEGSREQAITDLIQSVALQEAALSHILNAEGEKMQKIIGMHDVSQEELLRLNRSVQSLVNAVTRLEMIFLAKLELFEDEMHVEHDQHQA
ncbi:MAG: hypothetical protein FWD98_09640 [Defluviitaleaceae bacterium]|nr:hypothetical protein [Defluviitaleaceae bacterium]